MEELTKQICEKFGIDASKADGIVQHVITFVKEQLPENLQGMLGGILGGNAAESGEGGGDMLSQAKNALGGLFSK